MGLQTPARDYHAGMGSAVADRTVNRKIIDPVTGETRREIWAEVAARVSLGNSLLDPRGLAFQVAEKSRLEHHLRQASCLMSGRHLQHGDETQPTRNMEVFTNCGRADTELLTLEHGVTTLGEIAGKIVTVRCADGQWRPARAKAYGTQRLFKLMFSRQGSGPKTLRETYFTRNHRWLLADGTVTDAIKVGDVLQAMPVENRHDGVGVVHGLIYGDGTAHKSRNDRTRHHAQGRTYASIRICKQDSVREEIHNRLDRAGYGYSTPASAAGDRVYYIGNFEGSKELPFTRDPEYLAGFIRGWWLADGHKTEANGTWTISTADELAADWLVRHAGYAGLSVISHNLKPRRDGDGSFANGKALHIVRLRENVRWVLDSIEEDTEETVYCVEEPVTQSFTLANGLVTGNCATAATTFLLFYLLLNGSGVGRAYDDDMIKADFNKMPIVVPVIEWEHADVASGKITGFLTKRDAEHLYADRTITVFDVPDSREGWAKGIEVIERMTFEERREEVLILDFSAVRPNGSPIHGMQGRPASGPGPLMGAVASIAKIRDAGMTPWRAAMYADHYAAECVLVGGARRAARMATKTWRDRSVLQFISVKRGGFLWSSNNSVTIDEEFRAAVRKVHPLAQGYKDWNLRVQTLAFAGQITHTEAHAYRVLQALARASYFDGTGEPGVINQDKLTQNTAGMETYLDGLFAESAKFKLDDDTLPLMRSLAETAVAMGYQMITNPCGEIALIMLGGYCVIADVVPFHAQNDDDAEDAFRTAVRALIRTNLMDCLYSREVQRTNRIGVGMTGFHEWVYNRFGFTWRDLVDEEKSKELWLTVARFKRAIVDEAECYSKELGVVVPHTNTTFKPAGTTSKLFGLCEGAHLPSMREFLRWVQFRNDDPLVAEYEAKGYPVKRLETYSGTTIVGFPTRPRICELGDGSWVVTAAEATPEEQYQFLRLLEKYWIRGVEADGVTPLAETGNQVSYTLKYDPKKVDFDRFLETLIEGQFSVRCCSVMPQSDTSAYEYQPEQPVTKHEFEMIASAIIASDVKEDVDFAHIDCGSGACPIDFEKEEAA